jgi:hypothetical protein
VSKALLFSCTLYILACSHDVSGCSCIYFLLKYIFVGAEKRSLSTVYIEVNVKNLQYRNTSHSVCFAVSFSCIIETTLPALLSILLSRLLVCLLTKMVTSDHAKGFNIKYYSMVFRTTRTLEKSCGVSHLNTGMMNLNYSQDMEFLVCFVILETVGLIPHFCGLLIEWYL